ncbi:MAG: OmpP1/FadL family transporter [Roseibium sp.]
MSWANHKRVFYTSTALAVLLSAGTAQAGGFALREQSSYFQGISFAGYGTSGDSISSMFWNPASLSGAQQGFTFEAHNSIILPFSELNGQKTGGIGGNSTVGSGDLAIDAWVPATYASFRVNEQWVLGLGLNAPFGLSTKADFNWAGQLYSRTSEVFSLNVNPTVTYQLNDMISFGLGAQVQYLDVRLTSADATSGAGFPRTNEIIGDDIGFGVTAGLSLKPMEGTEIGLGYRSGVNHGLSGKLSASGRTNLIDLNVITPDMVNLSASQKITDKIRLLGTVEWTNWSRLKAPRATLQANGATATTLHFNYDDGWFFSVGGEYEWNDKLTFRTGFAYEISPIDTEIRSTRLPDNNRWWLSAGASYDFNKHLAFDLGYTHIIPQSTNVNIVNGHQDYDARFGSYTADVDSNVNIFSASLRYKF